MSLKLVGRCPIGIRSGKIVLNATVGPTHRRICVGI
jgi:hypothetical protein